MYRYGPALIGSLLSVWPALTADNALVPTYGTYFGGTGAVNAAVAVAVDASGNVIIAGRTTSQSLPGASNSLQATHAHGFPDNEDVYIAKFDPSGAKLLWSTFLGGDGLDKPSTLAVDPMGNIYVAGETRSSTFPVTAGAYLGTNSIPGTNGFAAKISADGRSLTYATYLPGVPTALAVSSSGEAYFTGTFLPAVITPGALGSAASRTTASNGVWVIGLRSGGTGLLFGAYLGGGGLQGSQTTSLALDSSGNVYVAGYTGESNIPTTSNALQAQHSNPNTGIPCCSNGFILEVSSGGSQLLYGTYFGPRYYATTIESITVASGGALYFSGHTTATGQATPGAYFATAAPGFVARLALARTAVDAYSYLPADRSFPPVVKLGNQPPAVYATFVAPSSSSPVSFHVVGLDPSTLGLVSSFTSPSRGFVPSGVAPAAPHSFWLAGSVDLTFGTMGGLISDNAFQPAPQTQSPGVLIQLTEQLLTITKVVNAASSAGGAISPGEIVAITGSGIGPTTPAQLTFDSNGKVASTLGGVQALFNGVAAPLIYVSATQINAVVPYEIQGFTNPYVQVRYVGSSSDIFQTVSTAAAPGIFTANGSGTGPVAALNQDGSYNAPNNPAAKGSYIACYVTGEGQTAPPGITGRVTLISPSLPLTPQPLLPVTVSIGEQAASVAFFGEAPGFVAGLMQLNVRIPENVPSGNLPILVSVGGISSQSGVTLSVY